jgi:hypothetical protein
VTPRKPAAGKLDPRTLRWASRRMRRHQRMMRECQDEAESRQGAKWRIDAAYYMAKSHAYGNAAVALTLEARALESRAKRKAKR